MPKLLNLVPKNFGAKMTPEVFQTQPSSPVHNNIMEDSGLNKLINNDDGQFVGMKGDNLRIIRFLTITIQIWSQLKTWTMSQAA